MNCRHILIIGSLWTTIIQASYDLVATAKTASIRTEPFEYIFGQEPDAQASKNMFGESYELFIKSLPPELRDPGQGTEVLYNENVVCLEKLDNNWLKVELPEQYGYSTSKQQFEHELGYIKKDKVSIPVGCHRPNLVIKKPWATIKVSGGTSLKVPIGTKLYCFKANSKQCLVRLHDKRIGSVKTTDIYGLRKKVIESNNSLRTMIISSAQQLIGTRYCWGGRSPKGCDCSGLVNLAYRTSGLELPRNSHPMWLRSGKINHGSQLEPGDLIFFAHTKRKKKIHHVLMYMGNEQIIESCLSKGVVIRKAQKRFGKPVASLKNGDIIRTPGPHPEKYVIYFGSYLGNRDRIQYMRDYALGNYDVTRWVQDEQNSQIGTTKHTDNIVNK